MKIILLCILIVSVIPRLCSSVGHVAQKRSRRQANACRDYEEFSCRAGKCISRYEVCDGVRNCPDGSDETAQACRQVSITSCPTTLFRCQYGACVSLSFRCDNKRDCPDGSDEFGCNNNVQHQQISTVCNDEFSCRDGSCISSYSVCDGVRHCPDGSDETATACQQISITSCPSWTFKCQYGACINSNLRCNGKADCNDGSDEIGCTSPSFHQQQPTTATPASVCNSAGDIQCDNGQCVSQYSMCDGVIDCGDRSDETEAVCFRVFEGRCPAEHWRCAYGACLRQSTHCDGRQDCWDGSDEASCPPPFSSVIPAPVIPSPTSTAFRDRTCELPREAMNRHFMDHLGKLRLQPGQPVKHTGVVLVTCDPQYQLTPPQTYVVCNGGQWSHEFSKCAKLCPSLSAPTLDLTCRAGWEGLSMSCDKPMLPGTVVKFKCKEYYELNYFNQLDMILCDDSGQWSMPLPPCKPKGQEEAMVSKVVVQLTAQMVALLGTLQHASSRIHQLIAEVFWLRTQLEAQQFLNNKDCDKSSSNSIL